MTALATTTGPSAYWYLTRGTGAVALILLTVSVVLGVVNVRRARTASVPRFVFDSVHRNASLLALVFLVAHIITSLLDGYAPIKLLDTIVPFTATYRPLWLGFGALAFDLLVAVAITSMVRRRLGYRVWRITHWAAYGCWPIALLHGLGTGSDVKTTWMLAINGACLIAVIVAVVARATAGWPAHVGARATALAASAAVPLGLLVWLPSGPLAAGWAKRAGTPPALLGAVSSRTAGTSSAAPGAGSSGSSGNSASSSTFSAQATGTVRQGRLEGGLAEVHITLALAGQQLSRLGIRLIGRPVDGGGVQMTSSRVALGSASSPEQYRGVITALEGTNIQAHVTNAGGASLTISAQLQIDGQNGTAAGTVTVGG